MGMVTWSISLLQRYAVSASFPQWGGCHAVADIQDAEKSGDLELVQAMG